MVALTYTLCIILMVLTGIANAFMDKLQFHFDESVFSHLRGNKFWDPKISWTNKWKHGDKALGEKFFLSSTVFVFTTDAWHMFKWVYGNSIFIGLILYATTHYTNSLGMFLLGAFCLMIIQRATFEYFFRVVLKK